MSLDDVQISIRTAQNLLAEKLLQFLLTDSFTHVHYGRYLSMQYHLTKGVQAHFLTAAGHGDFFRRRKLREFLFTFANEEESHYLLAFHDLEALEQPLHPMPFDVELWHEYFGRLAATRPFVRLGATCILENISGGSVAPHLGELLQAPFLNQENTTFISVHTHETLPHGEQFIAHLSSAGLDHRHVMDLVEGASKGGVLYLRMLDWVFMRDVVQKSLFEAKSNSTYLEEGNCKNG